MAVTINGTSGITDVDGSAGAPAITGTDTDTGLFFSTNILGLSTGGSERVRVDSSGNVGIGVSSLASPSASRRALQISNSTSGGILYLSNSTTESDNPRIFGAGSTQYDLGFAAGSSTGIINWYTNGTERARIDSSGNLGLGVTPSAWSTGKALEIGFLGNALWGNAADEVIVSQNAYYNSGWKYATSRKATHYSQYDAQHRWFTAPSGTAGNAISWTQAMTLDASSNLNLRGNFTAGSAVTTTGAVFGVDSGGSIAVGASSGDAVIRGAVGSGTTNRIVFAQGNTGNIYGLFDGSGNVLIGSPTYTRRLSVKDTTNTVVVIEGSNSGSSNINFADSDSENPGSINYSHSTNYMAFQTAGAERMRIESDGLLQISKGTYTGLWIGDAGYKMFVTAGRLVAQNGSNGVELAFNASAWAAYSDIRAKTSLTPITDAKTKLKTARTVTGRYITDSEDVSRSFLIAQDWFEILPESVDASDPERLSLRYTETIPLIAAAVNEQTDEIAELKAIIESLTARIAALEAQ